MKVLMGGAPVYSSTTKRCSGQAMRSKSSTRTSTSTRTIVAGGRFLRLIWPTELLELLAVLPDRLLAIGYYHYEDARVTPI
jgi:hypothetical protein